jgi:hypothetical protein
LSTFLKKKKIGYRKGHSAKSSDLRKNDQVTSSVAICDGCDIISDLHDVSRQYLWGSMCHQSICDGRPSQISIIGHLLITCDHFGRRRYPILFCIVVQEMLFWWNIALQQKLIVSFFLSNSWWWRLNQQSCQNQIHSRHHEVRFLYDKFD